MPRQILLKILFILVVMANTFLPGVQESEKTTFTLSVLLDETCDFAKKRSLLTGIIADISSEFERDFAIAFAIKKWEKWRSSDPAHSLDSLAPSVFKQAEKRGIDIAVVYFYKKDYKQALEHTKEAEGLGFKVNEGFKKELEKYLRKT